MEQKGLGNIELRPHVIRLPIRNMLIEWGRDTRTFHLSKRWIARFNEYEAKEVYRFLDYLIQNGHMEKPESSNSVTAYKEMERLE